ncbi:MAG: ankyrin repeat domain-containing protein, partial [Longimicrobiales bacterium]
TLGYAAIRPDSPLPLINMLLAAGARADIAGDDGWNAVQRAARSNNLEMLQLLTRRRAPLNGTSAAVAPALWIAVEYGHVEAARILLRGGASPYLRWDGRSAIDLARAKNYASLVALMQMR